MSRYFNSWLETCEDNSSSDDTSSSHTNTDSDTAEDEDKMSETPSYSSSVESVIRRKTKSISQSLSEELNDDGLSQVPPPCDVAADDDDSSSDESSSSDDTDIEDVFGQSHRWLERACSVILCTFNIISDYFYNSQFLTICHTGSLLEH